MDFEHSVILSGLSSERDLSVSATVPAIAQQLHKQSCHSSSLCRYQVTIQIVEGKRRPATDVDNYAKKAIDGISRTRLLWRDDKQIDMLIVKRRRDPNRRESQIVVRVTRIEGQHSGVPTFFRACCLEASEGRQFTYAHPGYHLALHLHSQQPYDLAEEEWTKEIEYLCRLLDSDDVEGAWNWFCEHFPKCMKLVPKRRLGQFVAGVSEAYADGRISS